MIIKKSFSDAEANTFDIIDENDVQIAYYHEHFVHPDTKEKLESPVYEIYYDYDAEYDDYATSFVTEDFQDIEEIIEGFDFA
jgi:hypothetical protein